MMKMIIWFLRISVFAILAVFASQNFQPVVLQYYLDKSIELPLSAVMLVFFALGIFITVIFTHCRFRSEK